MFRGVILENVDVDFYKSRVTELSGRVNQLSTANTILTLQLTSARYWRNLYVLSSLASWFYLLYLARIFHF